jgi:beta-lactamase superfamily II metal-dependent hydrolase
MAEKKQNTARKLLWPANNNILVRVVFLYVGQGSSAIVFVADGQGYKVLVVDINLDEGCGGIDVPRLMKDLMDGQSVHAFVNTHPHDDHVRGVVELSDACTIDNVWHSGHIPSKKHGDSYDDLKGVMAKVEEAGGSVVVLEGSRSPKSLGEAQYYVLAPASHVTDDVNEDDADARYNRIHEMCAVLKFGKGANWIMILGDADRAAFENHITEYHKDRLAAFAVGASHHGSRTFFRENEDDDPYLDGLNAIDPSYVVVSAPRQSESKHEHPHDDAMELYADYVGEENVLHTGAERYCYFFDIYKNGTTSGSLHDSGVLAKEYGLSPKDDGDGGNRAKGGFSVRESITTIGGGRYA